MKLLHNTLRLFFILIGVLFLGFNPSPSQAEIKGLFEVEPGLYRGSYPESAEDFKKLESLGIKTILNLQTSFRAIDLEKRQAQDVGIHVESMPIPSLRSKMTPSKVLMLLNVMKDPELRPLFIHCRHGRDRTGFAIGMYRIHEQKWEATRTYQEMKEFGFRPYITPTLYWFFKTHLSPGALVTSEDDQVPPPPYPSPDFSDDPDSEAISLKNRQRTYALDPFEIVFSSS
ncbi:MAG: fused DSP-PTPase phosphatase/NAD kinase-like protein [Bdellovibrionia bacterium]